MFFGMTNSPATFQTMMNDIFRNLIAEGIVVVYLDDILIFTKTEEEHAQAVQQMLRFHGSGESRRSLRMAYSGEQDGRPGFPRLRELLPKIHSGLFC